MKPKPEMIRKTIPPKCDIIVIGGGHNGLVAASLLAKAGKSVQVFEAASHWGGAVTSKEIMSGVRINPVVQQLGGWPQLLTHKLNLPQHGLNFAPHSDVHTVALAQDGRHVILQKGQARGEALSESSAQEWQNFTKKMGKFVRALAPIMSEAPPILSRHGDFAGKLSAINLALRVRLMGRRDMREFLRVIGMNAYDLAHDYLSHPLLQGVVAFDACHCGYLGPRAPGTILPFMLHLATEAKAAKSLRSHILYDKASAQALGGVDALPKALVAAAEQHGATLNLNSKVRKIIIEDGAAIGIELQSGKQVFAKRVVAAISPKSLMLDLVGAAHLDSGFVQRMHGLTARGRAAIMHLVLNEVPQFTGLNPEFMRGRILIAPSAAMVERAFDAPKYGKFSLEPPMAITIPSLTDPSLAPKGTHILSALVLGAPDANDSCDAAIAVTKREGLLAACLRQIEPYAPSLKSHIIHQELSLPSDIKCDFDLCGGAWHGVDLSFDRFYALRPSYDLADYTTPIENFYATGAAFHPGGGVTGWPGHNVARKLLSRRV